uniref:Uncharacterized protein n=1 Tax=Wolfiporia cocos TaxID=81056 RepID=A0A7G7YDY5_9APHY|nr:hypothetical protein [Wolfiporia cocos]
MPYLISYADTFSSRKKIDFLLWVVILILNKTGIIRLPEGKALAEKIESIMNHRRYSNNPGSSSIVPVSQDEIDRVLSLTPPFDLNSGKSHYKLAHQFGQAQRWQNIRNGKTLEISVYSPNGDLLCTFLKPSEVLKALPISKTSYYKYLNSGRIFKNQYLIVASYK